ncbi:uncharacterized protein LOC127287512 [Leptopilina boulardi]|uniref:uncharacterized protein LOC127287512 n=1 Tax=Leptopilina boulardi TaxID=63433 RepID=UPI0021F5F9BD|nr:uncharacterized protein LOC127287512 [Leptopilina boulardi]
MRRSVRSDVEEVTWHQEYRWSWTEKKFQYRGYWDPASFQHPTFCVVPDNLEIEEIQGCLGVNISNYPYSSLPAFQRTYGPRPTNPALELIFCQIYREAWEEIVLVDSRWETVSSPFSLFFSYFFLF